MSGRQVAPLMEEAGTIDHLVMGDATKARSQRFPADQNRRISSGASKPAATVCDMDSCELLPAMEHPNDPVICNDVSAQPNVGTHPAKTT